jgi:hypothetical protein
MSEETVWQGLAAILPIFHWTVLRLGWRSSGLLDKGRLDAWLAPWYNPEDLMRGIG